MNLGCAIVLALTIALADPQPPTNTQPFQLIEQSSRRFAYVEHTGPYWTLGPIIERVALDAKAQNVGDQLVVRYLQADGSTTPGHIIAQVGYELRAGENPKPPYQAGEIPSHLTATKTVEGSDGLSTRHFAALKIWSVTQDLSPDGDMIALVTLAERGDSTAIARTELFLPVCVADPTVSTRTDDAQKSAQNAANSGEMLAPVEPARRMVTKVIPLSAAEAAPPEAEPSDAEHDNVEVVEVTPEKPKSAQVILVDPPARKPAPIKVHVPIREWIEAKQYQDAAGLLLQEKTDPATREWFDQFAARIIALAGGVQKNWPGEGGWLADMSTALAARRTALRPANKGASRAPAPSMQDLRTPEQKALTRELDMLMGQVAYRTTTPAEVRDRLMELLEAAVSLE